MTARSRTWFWALTSILALLLLLAASVVGYRTWQVERSRKALAYRDVLVVFHFQGPRWLEPLVPEIIANAWVSETNIMACGPSTDMPINDRDWEALLPELRQLPNVVYISMVYATFGCQTFESFVEFSQLRSLSLWHVQFEDADLSPLVQCTQLTMLGLLETSVSDHGLEHLKEMTQLRALLLFETQITDEGLVHLSGLKNLETLALDGTQITDDGLSHLTSLTNLQVLYLDDTQITEDGLVHLRKLTKLKELSVSQTGLPESALMSLEVDMPGLMISDD